MAPAPKHRGRMRCFCKERSGWKKLAARGGIKKVLIPEENAKDLADIPDNVKSGMEIIPVSHVDEVLRHVLLRQPEAITWDEEAEEAAAAAKARERNAAAGLTAH